MFCYLHVDKHVCHVLMDFSLDFHPGGMIQLPVTQQVAQANTPTTQVSASGLNALPAGTTITVPAGGGTAPSVIMVR